MALQPQATKFQVLLRVKEVIAKFKSFDLNGDGKISRSEIIKVFGYVPSDEEIVPMATKFQVLLRVKEVIAKFKSFDLNGDGKISRSEIIEVFGYVPSDEEIRSRVGTTDCDGDGCINLQEFIRANTGDMNVDKSGHITADQLHSVLKRLGDPASLDDCRQFMAALRNDGDGNGRVTFDEFQVLLPTANTTPAY